jgi:hypothetical protein
MRTRARKSGGDEPAKPAWLAPSRNAREQQSPEASRQARLVNEQRRASAIVRAAAASVSAPAHLRAWLAAQGGDQDGRPSTRRTTRRRPR